MEHCLVRVGPTTGHYMHGMLIVALASNTYKIFSSYNKVTKQVELVVWLWSGFNMLHLQNLIVLWQKKRLRLKTRTLGNMIRKCGIPLEELAQDNSESVEL